MRDFLMGRGANPFAVLLSSILTLAAIGAAIAGQPRGHARPPTSPPPSLLSWRSSSQGA